MSIVNRLVSEPVYGSTAFFEPVIPEPVRPPSGTHFREADTAMRFGVLGDRFTATDLPAADKNMVMVESWWGQYFNRVYAVPARVNLVDPVIGNPNVFRLFNASLKVQTAEAGSIPIGSGIELSGIDVGDVIQPFGIRNAYLTVTPAAPPTTNVIFTFAWDNAQNTPLPVYLSRTNTLAVPPEQPLNVTYSWKTDIATARDGTEQRSSIRHLQRVQYDMSVIFDTEEGQDLIYRQFFSKGANSFTVPVWESPMKLSVAAQADDTSLFFDPDRYDIQVGDQLLMFHNDESYETVNVLDVVDGQAYLYAPLQNDFLTTERFYRVTSVLLPSIPKLSYQSYAIVQSDITLRETTPRILFEGNHVSEEVVTATILTDRVTQAVTPTLAGVPIVHARPIVRQNPEDSFDWNFEIMDFETGAFSQTTARTTASVSYTREYYVRYYYQEFVMNALFNWMHGMRKPLWLPTWMNELRTTVTSASGDTVFTSDANFASEYRPDGSHRGLWMAYKGGWLARKITDCYSDDSGKSIIKITPALPDDYPLEGPYDIGHLVLCRLGSDEVKVERYSTHAFFSMTFTSTFSTSTDA